MLVVCPENRRGSEKVRGLIDRSRGVGIPVLWHERKTKPDSLIEEIRRRGGEVGISWSYSQMFPVELLNAFPRGILNMHGGKIPEYRGANVLPWAILNGETEIGVTWHGVVEEVDAGPIWDETVVPVCPDDTSWTMRAKIIEEGLVGFAKFWPRFKRGSTSPPPPDLTGGRDWPRRRPKDSELPDQLSEQRVRNYFRALCPPWPAPFRIGENGETVNLKGIVTGPQADTIPYLTAEGKLIHLQIAD